MSNSDFLQKCPRCNGTGFVTSKIEEGVMFRCNRCGGHKLAPNGAGPVWFYKGVDWRYGWMTQRVAVAMPEPGEPGMYRVTIYAPDGPQRHYFEREAEAFSELKEYRMTDFGARTVDAWSKTGVWENGLKRLAYTEYQHILARIPEARKALYDAMDKALGLDEMLRVCRALKAQYAAEVELW